MIINKDYELWKTLWEIRFMMDKLAVVRSLNQTLPFDPEMHAEITFMLNSIQQSQGYKELVDMFV